MAQDQPIDAEAFQARVLENVLAGRPALEGAGDIIGEERASEWQALSGAAIESLERQSRVSQVVANAMTDLIRTHQAATRGDPS